MKELKTEKYKGSFLLKFAVLCLAVGVVVAIANQQVQISEKETQLSQLKTELQTQTIKNEEIRYMLKNGGDFADYAEKVARRDLDYAKPGERVFVNIGGND